MMTRKIILGALILLAIFCAIGGLAFASGVPLLFPSLGPTALVQLETPNQAAARPWNTLVGHATAILVAVIALAITGARHAPEPILTGILTWSRELASAIAVMLTFVGQALFRATHAPAAATALLLTLGAINPERRAVVVLCIGVVLITVLGEAGRWMIKRAEAPRD